MVITNFTLAGDNVKVLAREADGALFDLIIADQDIATDCTFSDLINLCAAISAETGKLAKYWEGPGFELFSFNERLKDKEESDAGE